MGANNPSIARLTYFALFPGNGAARRSFDFLSSRVPDYCPHTKLLRDGKIHRTEIHEERLGGF